MQRRQVLGLGLASLFLSACSKDYYRQILTEFYQKQKLKEANHIQRAFESIVMLETETEYKLEDKVDKTTRRGMGVVYDNYVLTVDHIVSQYGLQIQSPFGVMEIDFEKLKETTTLDGKVLEEIVNEKEKDIAVFKLPPNLIRNSYPFSLGDTDKLQYGQEILLIGNPALSGFNVREGIVSRKVENNRFAISANIVPGDSGTIVVDRNTFELLGLNAQKWYNEIAVARPINLYKPYLK